jgi:ubiquinone biosynthesis protein
MEKSWSEERPGSAAPAPDPPRPGAAEPRGEFVDTGGHGLLRRLLAALRHLYGLLAGGLAARLRGLPKRDRRRLRILILRVLVAVLAFPVSRKLKRQPFPVQLRLRLELLGPTYIKLGQILAMREDLLPEEVTDELKKLLDQLPSVSHRRFLEAVESGLGRPVEEMFAHVRSVPLGSASIGQAHLATTLSGQQVILKIVKPGIRRTLRRDTLLLRGLGSIVQVFAGRLQPKRILREFTEYTLREVDLRQEADNAEAFASAFRDQPGVVFPKIYREYSSETVLCMEYLEGIKPTDPQALELPEEDRRRLVELGAEAIINMIYRDGFFHADLHPANLLILPGPRCGFVDLGMVGRLERHLKHTLLYYYYSLVSGDSESAATYLALVAETGPRSDATGFRREVEEVCRHWSHRVRFEEFSLARLILQSIAKGARYRMYFPMEMVLMVKATVTFEAVGHLLLPGIDIAQVSRQHLNRVLLERFAPTEMVRSGLTALPELADGLSKAPRLITEGLRLVERATKQPRENPLAGMRATLFGGFCLVAGAILAGTGSPWPLWASLFAVGLGLALRPGR